MAAILEQQLFLLFLDNMATILGFALFRQYGRYLKEQKHKMAAILSKKSKNNRRSKIAVILSKKNGINRRSIIAAILSKSIWQLF
jgi:hypothetical protein